MDSEVLSILETPGQSVTVPTVPPTPKSRGRLFSASQVAVATFLGSPLAGGALLRATTKCWAGAAPPCYGSAWVWSLPCCCL
jgi:hypothetical protein